jgi:hypothetical protein
LRAGDEDSISGGRAEGDGQFVADNDGRRFWSAVLRCRSRYRREFVSGPLVDGLQKVANFAFVLRNNALDERAARARPARDEHLSIKPRRDGLHMGNRGEPRHQRTPVADAVPGRTHQVDMGCGADEAFLQVAAHAVGNSERDDQRGDSRRDADDGDSRDESDDSLPTAGAQVPGGDKKLKTHLPLSYRPGCEVGSCAQDKNPSTQSSPDFATEPFAKLG